VRFANPAGLWLSLLAVPVVVLHVLRPRRPPVEVSSTFLWREVARPVSVAAPWQRLRPSVLLALQLLAVVLLAGAVARPVRATGARLAEHTVFILDASGSMAATDGRPDRLAAAKDRARALRRQVPGGGVASLVVVDSQPRVVLSTSPDPDAFAEALAAVRATAGGADFATAFTLAESLETPGVPVGFLLLSDGGLTDVERRLLPPGTDYQRAGSRSTNRAITRLTVEPRGSALHARVSLGNTGGPAATQDFRLDVDGRTAVRERVELAPGATVEREVDLPGGDRVEAFLEGEDLLAADNRAVAVAQRRRPLKVLLAGPGDLFLERLLATLPTVTVERSEVSTPAPGYDLAVYDGVAVPADPGAPFLAVAPPGGATGVTVTGEVGRPAVVLVRADDDLLAGLDLSEVAIARAQRIDAPGDEVLLGAEGTPLLVRGSRGGRAFAYLGFSLAESTLPLQVAFPVLADRLVSELAGATLPPTDLRVGQPLPVTPNADATVDAPGGVQLSLAAGGAPPIADRAGFWTVRQQGRPELTLAVNPDPDESTLAPADTLPAPERPAVPGQRRQSGELPQLRWVVAALLAVLAAELWLSSRRRGVPRRQWRAALVARGLIVSLLVGALVGLAVPRTARRVAVVFLVDASDSLGPAGRAAAVDRTQQALRAQPRGSLAGVAFFGGDARLELTVQHRAQLLRPATTVDASRTDLAGALRLAAAVLPADARRRIVVVSDGRPTEGDAATEARRLREDGIRVDVHPVDVAGGPDAAVARVDAPGTVRQGEAFTVRATINSTRDQPLRLRWSSGDRTVEERVVEVPAGQTVVELAQTAVDTSGTLSSYRLDIQGPANSVAQNDVGFAAVQVEGPARVLVAEGAPGVSSALTAALRAGGTVTEVVAATELPALDRLATYSSTVLVDVDAHTLSGEQVATLGAVTRDLGRGLVVVGGDRSFALGGYLDSELEKLLPVVSDIKDPKRRPSVAQVLAIDSSGSMGACHCREGGGNGLGGGNLAGGGINKTDISRAAAARTVAALSADDQVGVLAFNTDRKWIVPLQTLPAEEVVTKGLRELTPAGGTNLTLPLKEAGEALRAAKARLKHVILFTDGFTSVGGLDTLVEQARALAADGITVSVVATGETGARENLSTVAEAGRGRFYNETDLSEVPQIMMQEAILASRQIVNEGEVFPKVVSQAPPVRDLRQAPPLFGYLGTTAKPAASTHLQIGEEGDPLLASWQAGLGRVTAWTSDASARWSQAWAAWEGYTGFWAGVVKDTFPLGGSSGAAVRAELVEGTLRVTAESATEWPDGATATARVAGPDLVGRELRLERTSGTTFVGETAATAPGSYGVGVSVNGPNGPVLSATTVAVQSYSPEYTLATADPATLHRVSALSGGRGAIGPERAFDAEGLRAGRGRVDLAGWLLLAAALLWPVAVALSRVALHGAGAAAVRRAPRRLGGAVRSRLPSLPARPGRDPKAERRPPPPPPSAPVPAPPPTIERLLRRKRGEE
jgi:Ca-activated chloride channel homolog